jgi:hypothetical protein
MKDEPYHQKVGGVRLVTKQRCSNEVVVQCRDSLTRVNISEFHEWRFVLRIEDEWHTKIELWAGFR